MKTLMRRPLQRLCWLLALSIALTSSAWSEGGTQGMNERPEARYAIREAGAIDVLVSPNQFSMEEAVYDNPAFEEAFTTWFDAKEALEHAQTPFSEEVLHFSLNSARVFLDENGQENPVYSPVCLWFCLSVLADLSSGDGQAQVLSLLGADSPEVQSQRVEAARRALCWDDGSTACLPGASLWLNEGIEITPDALDVLADAHGASVFRGPMGDGDYDNALQSWLNRGTRGLLANQVSELGFDSQTQICAATTLYLKANWGDAFDSAATAEGVFHGADGDSFADFMHASPYGEVYAGEHFRAVILSLRERGRAFFLLPDEETAPRALLEDEEVARFLAVGWGWENRREGTVNLTLPKLDCTTSMPLCQGLQALGVTDLFDPQKADFPVRWRAACPCLYPGWISIHAW